MTNYKQQYYHELNLATAKTVKVPIQTGTKILELRYSSASDAQTITLHDADDNNYQVPTGKKSRIIYISSAETGHVSQYIINATVVDSATGIINMTTNFLLENIANDTPYYSIYATAGTYIGIRSTNASAHEVTLWIEERDA